MFKFVRLQQRSQREEYIGEVCKAAGVSSYAELFDKFRTECQEWRQTCIFHWASSLGEDVFECVNSRCPICE